MVYIIIHLINTRLSDLKKIVKFHENLSFIFMIGKDVKPLVKMTRNKRSENHSRKRGLISRQI